MILRKTKLARMLVFSKFVLWDKHRLKLTFKNCWVLAGINTVMPDIGG